tara:strand:+ start:2323 stop:2556 length:234 start_codon:yes stop_codon:yes gene_type:complete
MTLEELLDCDATKLESMDDATLLLHFQKYLNVTRPELAPRPKSTSVAPINLERQAKLAQLAKMGIDIDLSFMKKKKK